MLQAFFLWFYCLSISDAVLLVLLFSAAFLILRRWLCEKRLWQPVILLLLFIWLSVIAVATLTDRSPGAVPQAPYLIPFHSYRAVLAGGNIELLRSNFMNVVLFYPAGLLTYDLLPKRWSGAKKLLLLTSLFAMVSIGIEACQYHFALGQAEVDDVIHNALGALIGALVCTIHIQKNCT